MQGNKVFLQLCVKLSREIQPKKLKQLKFLLRDVMANASVLKDCDTFLKVIAELEKQDILQRYDLRGQQGRLLCEIFDALSLTEFANGICRDFGIVRDSSFQSVITPYTKLLVILSDNLNEPRHLEGMARFLKDAGHDILQEPAASLDAVEIFQTMEQAKLMSSDDLSLLKEILKSLSRLDLVEKIEELNKGCRVKKAYGLRYLPSDMIQRKPELDAVLDLLKSGKNTVGVVGVRSREIVGIRGMGGIGKTVLAQAVAWSMSSNREVIWLDIGQTPDHLALVNTLVKALGGTRSFSDLPEAQSWIYKNTERKACLVVLDDVWNVDDAHVFDVLAGECQLLITTRDADVVRGLGRSTIYELGIMGKKEARRLLYQSAQLQAAEQLKFGENFQRVVEGLLEECRGLPLALALIGSSLVDIRHVQGWQDVLDDLKNADLESVRSLFPKDAYPYDHLLAAIDVSFQRLQKDHQDKFLDFAIFPEDTDIPSSILESYWTSASGEQCRGSVNARQARSILNVLEKRSMIQKSPSLQDEGKKAYRVHDLLLDFTRGKLRHMGHRMSDVQANFLDIFRHQCENGDWSRFPEENEYFFTYLPYHLCHAEKFEDLLGLFFNFEWLQRKVKVTSLASLISDFRFLDCTSGELKLLKSSLMLSADVLDKRSVEMGAQLLGRLHSCSEENPRVMKLLDEVREHSSKRRLLIPLHSCLTEPEGPLIKIFNRHSDTVFSLATADRVGGTIVISASSDHLIKVNELETGKELKVLEGHTMSVYCLALSHGKTMLASGSADATVRIWNLDSYVEVHELEGHGGYVNAVDFSVKDERLFSGSNDGSLKMWDVITGDLLKSHAAHELQIRGLCTTLDGYLVATASLDKKIKLWHAKTLHPVAILLGHTAAVYAVVSASDNTVLVSASGDKTVKVWDMKNYKELRSLCGHQEEVYSVSVTRDCQRVISGGKDMVVRLWCLATGEALFCFRGHSQSIRFVTVISDGSKALSGSQDTTFRVWDLNTSNLKQSEFIGHTKDVMDISINDNGLVCASSSMDGTVKIWCCKTGEELHTIQGHTRRAVSLAMSRDGAYVVSLAKDSFIKVWDLGHACQMLASVEMPQPRLVRFNQTHDLVLVGCEGNKLFIWDWRNTEIPYRSVSLPAFTTMEMAIDQDIVYICSSNAEVCKVDLANNNVLLLSRGPSTCYKAVMIMPDGGAILFGVQTKSSFIRWEMSSSREILCNTGYPPETLVTAIDITNDEKRVISGSSVGTLSQIHLKDSKIIQNYENARVGKGVRFVVVLKNDHHFVFVDETNTVELRSLDDTEKVVLGKPASQVTSACPVGSTFLLVGCENGELVFFDTAKAHDNHQAHDGAVTRLASNTKDGFLYFVSGSENGSVKFWFLTNVTPRVFINIWFHENVHAYPVTALAFVPGSEDVVSASYDNVVKRISPSGIVHEYPFQCYDIPAVRVVDNSLIATFVRSLSVVKWSVDDGSLVNRVHGGAGREQVARFFLPSGHVVSKGSHHSLVYWDLNSGLNIRTLRGHTHDIRALAFVPGGAFLLSGSRDKVLKLWSLKTGDLVDEFHFERYVLAISCASNGIVSVGLQGGQVCFMRVNNLIKPPG